jgi:hypothetical protein
LIILLLPVAVLVAIIQELVVVAWYIRQHH